MAVRFAWRHVVISYAIIATVVPVTATTLITYIWMPEPTSGLGTTSATYNWPTAGNKTITVTAAPLASVSITGPLTGVVNTSYAFTATVSPLDAMQPITYVWQAAGQSAATHTGRGIADSINFTWSVAGAQTITVTTSNALNLVSGNHLVNVVSQYHIYLPTIVRN